MSGSLARGLGGLGDAVGGTASARFSGNLEFNSGFGSAGVAYGCRAWVNFNGTGTVAIRASGNVSSITDRNAGSYTVNFTVAMPDANYAVVTAGSGQSIYGADFPLQGPSYDAASTSAVNVATGTNTNSLADWNFISVAVFR